MITRDLLKSSVIVSLFLGLFSSACAQESDTKNDASLTPWNDPHDPYVILLNWDDKTVEKMLERSDKQDRPKVGPIDLNRYKGGYAADAFPTFFNAPVMRFPEDLKAGDIDIAMVGATSRDSEEFGHARKPIRDLEDEVLSHSKEHDDIIS